MAYDWQLIKNEFIQGYIEDGELICPTLKQLSERHGCNYGTLRKRAAKEQWNTERNIYSTKRNKKILEKKEEILITEAASFDNKALQAAEKGIKIALEKLGDKNLSTHDHQKLSISIVNYQKVGKLALDEPTEHVKESGRRTVELDGLPSNTRKTLADIATTIHPEKTKPR
jgi:DNA-binding transcriptional regulator YhcF (GntR family)